MKPKLKNLISNFRSQKIRKMVYIHICGNLNK